MAVRPPSLTTENRDVYRASVGGLESNNNYGRNGGFNGAYTGRYQMGAAELREQGYLKPGTGTGPQTLNNPDNWTGKDGISSRQDFNNNPQVQDKVFDNYTDKNLTTLQRRGIVDENSSQEEIAGKLAVAHKQGANSASLNDPNGTDGFGTSNAKYYNKVSGDVSKAGNGNTPGAAVATTTAGTTTQPAPVAKTPEATNNQPGKDAPTTTTPVQVSRAKRRKKSEKPRTNPLHRYSSYNYKFAMAILTTEEMKSGSYLRSINPESVIIQSGGIDKDKRNPFFKGADFYIEDMEITSIFGASSRQRGTNGITLSFKIIEPVGCSLMERLFKAAYAIAKKSGSNVSDKTFAMQAQPFLITLEFMGQIDDRTGKKPKVTFENALGNAIGDEPAKKIKKYFPITITSLTFEINANGTTYNVEAVINNQEGLNSAVKTLQQGVAISGV